MECREQIPMFKVAMSSDSDSLLLKTLHSGWIGQGQMVNTFESCLSSVFNNKNVLTLSAGTHGLTLALRMCDVGVGDEVITTPLTCTATNMPILIQGAKIVWADIKNDLNIDPKSIKSCITNKTKAIVIVHWGGYPCDMDEIKKIAHEAGDIPIIEDCAHAYGSAYKGHYIGDCAYSDFAMFSFQAIKHLTCVDGGALCTKEKWAYDKGKLLRWYGIDRESNRKDMRCEEDIKHWGYKFHMNDINAVIGIQNMGLAQDNIVKARDNAMYYETELIPFDGLEIPQLAEDRDSSYWLFTMLVDDRTSFAHMMGSNGIAVSRVHERNDKHTCFRNFTKDLPQLEEIMEKMICIPVGWWLSENDVQHIIRSIKSGW